MTAVTITPWTLGRNWVEGPTGTFTYTYTTPPSGPGDLLVSASLPTSSGRYYRVQMSITATPGLLYNASCGATTVSPDNGVDVDQVVAQASSLGITIEPAVAGSGSPGDTLVVTAVVVEQCPSTIVQPALVDSTAATALATPTLEAMSSSAVLASGVACVVSPERDGATGRIEVVNTSLETVGTRLLIPEIITSAYVCTDGAQFFILGTSDSPGDVLMQVYVVNADGTLDRTVVIQDDAGPALFTGYSVAVTPDGTTLLVGCEDDIQTIDTTSGAVGTVFDTVTGSAVYRGGLRCLSDGRVLALWQTTTVPQQFTLYRYAADGTVQDAELVLDWDNLYLTDLWAVVLMVTPDESSVWVIPSGPATTTFSWSPSQPLRYVVNTLALAETLSADALQCTDGFVAPVEYRIPN